MNQARHEKAKFPQPAPQSAIAVALERARLKLVPKEVPKKPGVVYISDKSKFVLIFHCQRSSIPEGIQIISAGWNNTAGSKKGTQESTTFDKVQIDLEGLMIRCSVDSINVRCSGDYCRVYINCTAGIGGNIGFNAWAGGPYEKFVRFALMNTWRRADLKIRSNKTTLEMKYMTRDERTTKIRFAVKN